MSEVPLYTGGEIGDLLPNNQRKRRTCYALCHTLYPVSAAHMSIFRMDSNSTSYNTGGPGDDSQQKVAQLPASDAAEERVRAGHARPLLCGPEGTRPIPEEM